MNIFYKKEIGEFYLLFQVKFTFNNMTGRLQFDLQNKNDIPKLETSIIIREYRLQHYTLQVSQVYNELLCIIFT